MRDYNDYNDPRGHELTGAGNRNIRNIGNSAGFCLIVPYYMICFSMQDIKPSMVATAPVQFAPHWVQCTECTRWVDPNEHSIYNCVCPNCIKFHGVDVCNSCNEFFDCDELISFDDGLLCEDCCINLDIEECTGCNAWLHCKNLEDCACDLLCETCRDDGGLE